KLIASTASVQGAVLVNGDWSIGSRANMPDNVDGRFFGNAVDEVAIFTNALNASQLRSIFYSANVSPIILQAPQTPATTIYEGDTLLFTVWAEGNPTLTYQWTKNGSNLGGQTATNLTLANVTTNNSGNYAVIVTNPYGSVTNPFVLTVLQGLPLIVQQTQPSSATRYVGATIPFSVVARGSPTLTYQWKFNGTNSI